MVTKRRAYSSSSSSSPKADLASLFRLPTADIADRLNAMLATERQPHYRRRDYLGQRTRRRRQQQKQRSPRQGSSPCSASASSRSRSSSSRTTKASSSATSTASSSASSSVDPSSRAKIVQWLYDCADYLELQRECVAVATEYVDRFMSLKSNETAIKAEDDATVYQLIAISSLFLAAKQAGNKLSSSSSVIDAEVLARVSHGSYSAKEILDTENIILNALDWRLCAPTAQGFAHELIALLVKVLNNNSSGSGNGGRTSKRADSGSSGSGSSRGDPPANADKRRLHSVVDFTRLQIELAVADYSASVLRGTSAVALASVLNSMELLDFTRGEKRNFARLVSDCTALKEGVIMLDVNSKQIREVRMELQDIFDRQSNDVMSRAVAAASSSSSSSKAETSKSKRKDSATKSLCSTLSSRSAVGVDNVSELTSSHRFGCSSSRSRKNRPGRTKQSLYPSPHRANTTSFRRLQLEP